MANAKGLKKSTQDRLEYAVNDHVHDFRTSRKATVVAVNRQREGSRPLYEIRFPGEKETALRLRDDLDAA